MSGGGWWWRGAVWSALIVGGRMVVAWSSLECFNCRWVDGSSVE